MARARHRPSALAVAVVLAAAGCSTVRPIEQGTRHCLTYVDDVEPVVAQHCVSCHSGATPAAGLDLSTYLALVDETTLARVRAVLRPTGTDAIHAPLIGDLPLIARWQDECLLAYVAPVVHPPGIANPADPDFHAKLVVELGYDLPKCQGCHGDDFAGGKSKESCLGCHKQGPTACDTCHGQPPATGGHLAHVGGIGLGRKLACTECHKVPAVYTDVGHIFNADHTVDQPPAEVNFSSLAQSSLDAADRRGVPTWDGTRCQNVYCHGDALPADTVARNTKPAWSGGAAEASCGTCHGTPPSNHVQTGCSRCHGRVIDAAGNFVDASRHVDGKLSLGDESGTCTACHPTPGGAHAAHVSGIHKLRAPIDCTECHQVPQTVGSPGHIDHPQGPIVFPSSAGTIARAGGAVPTYTAATKSCADVWCHGGGALGVDPATTIERTPVWTSSVTIFCGACHGVPPPTPSHASNPTLAQCALCHAKTIDGTGVFVPGGGHINGVVDGN